MPEIDHRKELRHLYKPGKKEVAVVDVPQMNFLMIDGMGDPNTSQDYMDSIETLYAVSYTLKFMIKKGKDGIDYAVMPLEGLWWVDDMSQFSMDNRAVWKWTSMIMQPEFVNENLVNEAVRQVESRKNPPALSKLRFESFHEGLSIQIMHIGPYAEEGPVVEKLHNFIEENGYKMRGKHHEIYLSDPRRTKPENLKTVIRQPVG